MRVLSNQPPYSLGRLGPLSSSFFGGAAAAAGAGAAVGTLGVAGLPQLPKNATVLRDVVVVGRSPCASTRSTWNNSKNAEAILVILMARVGLEKDREELKMAQEARPEFLPGLCVVCVWGVYIWTSAMGAWIGPQASGSSDEMRSSAMICQDRPPHSGLIGNTTLDTGRQENEEDETGSPAAARKAP